MDGAAYFAMSQCPDVLGDAFQGTECWQLVASVSEFGDDGIGDIGGTRHEQRGFEACFHSEMTSLLRPGHDAGELANGVAVSSTLHRLDEVARDGGSESQMDTQMIHNGLRHLLWVGETVEQLEELQES